jgi:hypothetical protein
MATIVPPDGPVRLGAVQLPAGSRIAGGQGEPLLWATAAPVADAGLVWLELHDLHGQTGLAPILLAYLDGGAGEGRPWDSGELEDRAALSEVDRLDPAGVLSRSWADSLDPDDDDPEQAETVAPFSFRFPGLALRQDDQLADADVDEALRTLPAARIGLVPASRPADVLAVVGYNGTVNRYGTPAPMSAVLRSWEDRFGVVLLEVGFDHIRLLVRRPPQTRPAAEAAAAEIWAMCDEFWMAGRPGALTTVSEIADYVRGATSWSLWLD